MEEVLLRFSAGSVAAADLEPEISSIIRELADPESAASRLATASGLVPADLADAPVTVSQSGKGFGAVVILIAITTSVGAHAVESYWDDVIWPRLKTKLGADSVGKSEKAEKDEKNGK
jgi:hypothetical protein